MKPNKVTRKPLTSLTAYFSIFCVIALIFLYDSLPFVLNLASLPFLNKTESFFITQVTIGNCRKSLLRKTRGYREIGFIVETANHEQKKLLFPGRYNSFELDKLLNHLTNDTNWENQLELEVRASQAQWPECSQETVDVVRVLYKGKSPILYNFSYYSYPNIFTKTHRVIKITSETEKYLPTFKSILNQGLSIFLPLGTLGAFIFFKYYQVLRGRKSISSRGK